MFLVNEVPLQGNPGQIMALVFRLKIGVPSSIEIGNLEGHFLLLALEVSAHVGLIFDRQGYEVVQFHLMRPNNELRHHPTSINHW